MEENKFELVVCIVNAGFSQNVMEAARAAGARGGTILRARGSANPESEEFFNITIQPDKEMVMILVPVGIKDEVLKTVYKEAGRCPGHRLLPAGLPDHDPQERRSGEERKKRERVAGDPTGSRPPPSSAPAAP